jgi:hypothetical protein
VYEAGVLPTQQFFSGDKITFANTGTPTQYTISSVNYATRTISFTASLSGVVAGNTIFQYRAAMSAYRPMSRWTTALTDTASYTPSEWAFRSGYEKLFINGMAINEFDYDLTNELTFIQNVNGNLTTIQFVENILTTPAGASQTLTTNTVSGTTNYLFNYNTNAFELYLNGCLIEQDTDYTLGTGLYTLSYTPTTNNTMLQQTTYQRTGAA